MENINSNLDDLTFEEICQTITKVYYQQVPIEPDNLEKLFIKFSEQLFMRVFNVSAKPIVMVTDDTKYSGCYDGLITIKIYRGLLKQFLEGKALELFETISHEFTHFAQKRHYNNINIRNSLMEKDSYLKSRLPNYYDDNYELTMTEIDAFLSQAQDAKDILATLSIVPSEDKLAYSDSVRKEFTKNILTTNRLAGTEVKDIDELFLEEFSQDLPVISDPFSREKFLEFNPCIALEYKIIDNKLIRKPEEEIKEIYTKWQQGTLSLHGKPNEIDTYFKFILAKYNNKTGGVK